MNNDQLNTLKDAVYKISDAKFMIAELVEETQDNDLGLLLQTLNRITEEGKGNCGQYLRML